MPPVLFAMVMSQFAQAGQDHDLLFYTFYLSWNDRHAPPGSVFFTEMESCELFFAGADLEL
jgi:hypothetical protein